MACHRVASEVLLWVRESLKRMSLCLQIHYQIVFPLKYLKALLDKMEIKIIEETAKGIQERYTIEMETLGMDKNHVNLPSNAHPKI